MVRLARLEDAVALARVQVASWHTAYRGLISEVRLAAFTVPVRTEAWRRNLATRGEVRTTVFEAAPDGDGGGGGEGEGAGVGTAKSTREIVGFASIGRSRGLAGWGEIWAIYVAPDWWGRGVGSALFADAIAELASRGMSKVMLWVLEGNTRALQFYQGNGFVLDGARKVEDGFPVLRLRRG